MMLVIIIFFFFPNNSFFFFFLNLLRIFHTNTPGPLYNMVHYNTVLDIILITAGPHIVILDYICYMSIQFTLVDTRFG